MRQALRRSGHRLAAEGLVHGRSGNVSVRFGGGMVISRRGARVGDLGGRDLIWHSTDTRYGTSADASSEWALHAAVYTARSDVAAILHTHSPFATAWACMGRPLDLMLEEASYYGMSDVAEVVEHVPAGSLRLATRTVEALGPRSAVLLAGHGAVAAGDDLETALDVARSLEHQAHVAWLLAGAAQSLAGGLCCRCARRSPTA
jgi:L-fuculose-phosphate aldolase